MSVTKTVADRYTVRNNGEYAAIFINEWTDPGEKTRHLGEIAINSSFGSWAHQWTACSMPFRQFLTKMDPGYLMDKLARESARVFDGEASMNKAFQRVIKARGRREIDRDDARDLWDALTDIQEEAMESASMFIYLLSGIEDRHDVLEECWLMVTQKPNPQIQGFLRDLWPEFISTLQTEASGIPTT